MGDWLHDDPPPLLFVSGATGDAGHWARVSDSLARDYTVVSYDRRGNSRSPAPDGWMSTSMEEQADDAAALLTALELHPAIVVGSSGGAVVVLALLQRHPHAVRAAVVHEPPLLGLLPEGAASALPRQVQQGLAAGGPRAALEGFLAIALGGKDVFEALDPQLRERMLGNAEVFFGKESTLAAPERNGFESFIPDTDQLRRCGVPIAIAAGGETKGHPEIGILYDTSVELADRLGVPIHEVAGKHVPYFTHPDAFAAELREILGRLIR